MDSPRHNRSSPAFPWKRVFMVAGVCVLVGGAGYLVFGQGGGTKRRAPAPQVVSIQVPPPPPPPPPPRPKPPEPSQQTDTAQQMVAETAAEPEAAPAAPSNDAPLGTGVKGDGTPDSFGLGTSPGGGGGPRLLGSGGGGTRWAGYSGAIKTCIIEALGSDPRTRSADGQIEIGIWLDAGGRITRVVIRKSSADPAVDAAITRDVLAGLQTEPPPSDMPQPIWMRTTLRRPN